MKNFSGINFKVSPDLKRMSHVQNKPKKDPSKLKRENLEKEEEENKQRGRSSSFSDKKISQNPSSNIKNATNLQMDDSYYNNQIKNNHIINIKNMERELDRLMDKLIINLRERKVNSTPCFNSSNFGLNFDNVFKTNTSQIIKVKAVIINSEENKTSLNFFNSEIPDCEKKLEFNKEKDENKFIGRKRSLDSENSKDEVDSILSTTDHPTKNLYKVQKLEENNSNFSLQGHSKVQQVNENLVTGTKNPPAKKNYSLFDKFFLLFKKSCYPYYQVNVTMSEDKQEFTFSYTRKNLETVHYKILYDQVPQKILLMEKSINANLQLRVDDKSSKKESRPEKEKVDIISSELSGMLDDIMKNVEKKTN